jgi:hypothetical protein
MIPDYDNSLRLGPTPEAPQVRPPMMTMTSDDIGHALGHIPLAAEAQVHHIKLPAGPHLAARDHREVAQPPAAMPRYTSSMCRSCT